MSDIDQLINEFSMRGIMHNAKFPERKYYTYYTNKYIRIASGMYDYECDELKDIWLIEYYLFMDGRVMVWRSPTLGWIITPCVEVGFDFNGLANKWRPCPVIRPEFDIGVKDMTINDDMVVIYDNLNRRSFSYIATYLIPDIVDICETIKSQTILQKTPIICASDTPKDKDYIKRMIVDIVNNVKVIFTGKDLRSEIKTLDINAPFNVSDLSALLKVKESEILEYLGVDYQSTYQKKERLITAEQESNNQLLTIMYNDRLRARETGIKELNSKGLDIKINPIQTVNLNDAEAVDNGTDTDV